MCIDIYNNSAAPMYTHYIYQHIHAYVYIILKGFLVFMMLWILCRILYDNFAASARWRMMFLRCRSVIHDNGNCNVCVFSNTVCLPFMWPTTMSFSSSSSSSLHRLCQLFYSSYFFSFFSPTSHYYFFLYYYFFFLSWTSWWNDCVLGTPWDCNRVGSWVISCVSYIYMYAQHTTERLTLK